MPCFALRFSVLLLALLLSSPLAAQVADLLGPLGQQPVRIVCLGDSVTGVYYHTGGRRAYPEMLEVAIRRAVPTADVTVINAGISGHATPNGLERLDRDVLSQQPHLVTISFCLNDVVRVPIDTFRQNLVSLVKRCHEAKVQVVLCTPNTVMSSGGRTIAKISEYCEVLKAVAKEQQTGLCDQFTAGETWKSRDAWGWRLSMSDAIHPNMAGHKRMAEELCRTITGRSVTLDDGPPVEPVLNRTLTQIRARQPVRVLAMPPYDQFITAALQAIHADATATVTPWMVEGKTLAEIEQFAKENVRKLKPDLVVLAVPSTAASPSDDAFANSYAWVMNSSLSFGHQEWDCVVVHPAVLQPAGAGTHPRDELVRRLVNAQDLHLIDRSSGQQEPAAELFQNRLVHLASPDRFAPVYADKSDLFHVQDASGKLQPVKSIADWRQRVQHTLGNMQHVMGPLPLKSTIPLDVKILSETKFDRYTRRHVSFAVEPNDRAFAHLLVPHSENLPPSTRLPAMICLPGSNHAGKDDLAGVEPMAKMPYATELAERGYVCLVIDYPVRHDREYQTDPYAIGYDSATMKGIVNHRRGVDLLESLPIVDRTSIGVIGHSLGGHNALFLASFEPRIRAVVSSCGFNVFAKHAGGNVSAWSSKYYMPRIKHVYGDDPAKIPFDFTEVLAGLAPRPVFINAPLNDLPDFEVTGVYDCVDAALPVYDELFQAADRIETYFPDAGHSFPKHERHAAFAFLERHLKHRKETKSPITGVPSPGHVSRQIIAHRGSSIDRPENTLASILRAIETGATAVEVDIRTTKDGALVLSHDASLDRMTNGSGQIADKTLAELKQLDAGKKFDARFQGECIPTLAEALKACRGKIDVLLDLKETSDTYLQQVIQAVKESGDPRETIVGVRSVEQAKFFREQLPAARQIGLIAKPDEIEAYAAAQVDTIRLWPKWLTDETLVPRVRQAGCRLHLNGNNGSPLEVARLLKHQPSSLSSDDPERLSRTWRVLRGQVPGR